MFPPATDECLAEPEVDALARRLAASIEPEAGSLRIHVEFDQTARLWGVCAARGEAPDDWRVRTQVAARIAELDSPGPAPACLANARLEFNSVGALHADVRTLYQRCEERARAHLQGGRGLAAGAGGYESELRGCVDYEQARRGEIWLYQPRRRQLRIFVETRRSEARRAALFACAGHGLYARPSSYDAPAGVARGGPGVAECLEARGWRQVH